MLSDFTPMPTLAVKDLAAARAFYEGVLGFAPTGDAPDMALYTSGAGQFLVYPSSFAGTNKATYMAFQVPAAEFDSHVEALRSQGIEFQTFDYPGITWTDGIADLGSQRAVWFADPDGNILNLETPA
ncbi:MAG: VOC family protein [Actinomycetales bacterium]|nr:VOC family protein [Actinomycetales bacterium]